jgi:hypothetical protein
VFSKLPNLFDRDFAIGFFLPVSIFIWASIWLFDQYGFTIGLTSQITNNQTNTLISTTLIGLLSWIIGILLLTINKDIVRCMEGYGELNPFRKIAFIERRKFLKYKRNLNKLNNEYLKYQSENQPFPVHKRRQRNELLRILAIRFPDESQYLLPTSFGNIIRSFEVYSRLMYGLDSIPGWERLLGVIPESYRKFIDSAKSQVDFWVNICFLGIIYIIECLSLFCFHGINRGFWFFSLLIPIFPTILLIFFSFYRAGKAAVEWGNFIKSAFDLYIPDLYKKLNFYPTNSLDKRRKEWNSFSQAIIYSDQNSLPKYYKRDN